MNHNEEYKKLYTEFEDWAKTHYRDPRFKDMQWLESNYSLSDYYKQLSFYRLVRNLLIHNGNIGEVPTEDMINVTKRMIDEFKQFFEEISMPALSKAITKDNIISYSPEDKVLDAVSDMLRRNYTHTPVMQDGRIIGLFGENSLFKIISTGTNINQDTKFADIMRYIDINKIISSKTHKVDIVKFIKSETTIPECKNEFSHAIHDHQRLDIVFITSDGTPSTPVEGLITIWDLPALK